MSSLVKLVNTVAQNTEIKTSGTLFDK